MSLVELLHCAGDPDVVVARGRDVALTRGELLQRAALFANALPEPIPDAPAAATIALAFDDDRVSFVAALLATWHKGHIAAVAQNTSRERVMPVLQHPQTATMLHDSESGRDHRVQGLLQDAARPPSRSDFALPGAELTGQPALIYVETSADGQEHWRTWSASQLTDAVQQLATELPLAGDERIVHSYTPGFPSALFAGCLLPLARRTAIDLDRTADADSFAQRSHDDNTRALISDEVLLAQLARGPATGMREGCHVYCPTAVPQSLQERLPFTVRRLPSVVEPVATTSIDDPPAIEDLRRQDGIDDLAALSVPHSRAVIVAIAGPAAVGVADAAPPKLAATDDVRVLAFDTLPRDINRQLLTAEVFLAFGFGRRGQVVTPKLTFAVQPADGAGARLQTNVPDNYRFYEGHFATYPVMAGAVQLHELVLPCLHRLCGDLPALQKLDGIKFLARIAPGDTIDIVLERLDDPSKATFEVRRAATRCTAGRLQFAAPLPDFDLQRGD